MKTKNSCWVLFFTLAALICAPATAEDKTKPSSEAQQSAPAVANEARQRLLGAYHLEFSVHEIENGKRVNTRRYTQDLNSDDSNELKIGTRIPIESKQGEFEYLDVGTNIFSRLYTYTGQLQLSVRVEISNFATPNQVQSARPLIRQLRISGSTVPELGKPMLMGSVDDPNSNRQFQLEVTVTKLR